MYATVRITIRKQAYGLAVSCGVVSVIQNSSLESRLATKSPGRAVISTGSAPGVCMHVRLQLSSQLSISDIGLGHGRKTDFNKRLT